MDKICDANVCFSICVSYLSQNELNVEMVLLWVHCRYVRIFLRVNTTLKAADLIYASGSMWVSVS